MRDHESEKQAEIIIAALKEERLKQNISHDTLAELTGLSRPAISFIESGKRNPTLLTCLKIARALGINLADLIPTHKGFGVCDPKAKHKKKP